MEVDSGHPDQLGETSKEGLQRMRRLAASSKSLLSPSRAAIHPTTGQIIYPASEPYVGHAIATLHPPLSPRLLPTPPIFGPSTLISISEDGLWITVFHSSTTSPTGGTLVIYRSSVLSPLAKPSTVTPHSSLVLPSTPRQILNLYPPAPHTGNEKRSRRGPAPPPGYVPSTGPVLLVLTDSNAVFLIHPARMSSGDYQMNVVKVGLSSRCRAVMGEVTDNGADNESVVQGWMGIVAGNDSVWVALDRGEDVLQVVKLDVGTNADGRWYLQSTPMAVLSVASEEKSSASDLTGVVFVPITAEQHKRGYPEDTTNELGDAVGLAVIQNHDAGTSRARTEIALYGYERREVNMVTGFKEISEQHSDGPRAWDWFPIASAMNRTVSPPGSITTAITSLPDAPSPTSALAVLAHIDGCHLCHIDLAGQGDSTTKWPAIQGETVDVDDSLAWAQLVPTQGTQRGAIGLIALAQDTEMTLVVTPSLSETATSPETPTARTTKVAETVVTAMKEHKDWSDVIRVMSQHKGETVADTARSILVSTHELLVRDPGTDEISEIARLQIAFFGNDASRKALATEILRLKQVSDVLTAAATYKEGKIGFDLNCVWPLIDFAEWTYATLGQIMRECIEEKGRIEWRGEGATVTSLYVLFVAQPTLRLLVLRVLAQLRAFASFMQALNRPISQPETRYLPPGMARDPRATALAKDRAARLALREGVEVQVWGNVLQKLHEAEDGQADATATQALLQLDPALISDRAKGALQTLPTPSALFLAEQDNPLTYDAISLRVLQWEKGLQCTRCGWKTVAVEDFSGQGLFGGEIEENAWTSWRKERERTCVCGGVWKV